LFIIFTTTIAAIFLITTVTFTFLILSNIQRQTLSNLGTASKVLGYAIDSKTAETRANAEVIANDQAVATAVGAADRKQLQALTANFLINRHQSALTITADTGKVLLRATDPSRAGDSLSGDPLVKRALRGQISSSVTTREDVIAPLVYIETAAPIRNNNGSIVGAAVVGLVADNTFVDSIKRATGLESSIYSGNVRSATTFMAPDGKSRLVGVKEARTAITKTVIEKGTAYSGVSSLSNRQFLVVYSPLKDIDNKTVGMLLISQPQSVILRTAGQSIELTFILAVILIVLSIIPALLISRYLARQLK
jgi:methyl-accepting chemotaxis protein